MPRKLTRVQQALVDLRVRVAISQARLAQQIRVSQVSVARWETVCEPTQLHLILLAAFATEHRQPALARIFADALFKEYPMLREWEVKSA